MPYTWSHSATQQAECLQLWPHRSLPRRGFAAVILFTFLMSTIPLFGLIGTRLMWALLPFALIATTALWWGLERSYGTGEMHEELTLSPDRAHLSRRDPDGRLREWEANPYWVRALIHPRGGPVPHYVTLKGGGREVEIGAFLSEDERKALFGELTSRLSRYRADAGAAPDGPGRSGDG